MEAPICQATSHRRQARELEFREGEGGHPYQGPIPVLVPPPRARIKMRAAICRRCFDSVSNKASPWAELDPATGGVSGSGGTLYRMYRSPLKGLEVNRICDVYLDKAAAKDAKGQENDGNDQVWERCPTCGKLKKVSSNSPNSSFETIPEEE